jgi:hypothetical protein
MHRLSSRSPVPRPETRWREVRPGMRLRRDAPDFRGDSPDGRLRWIEHRTHAVRRDAVAPAPRPRAQAREGRPGLAWRSLHWLFESGGMSIVLLCGLLGLGLVGATLAGR